MKNALTKFKKEWDENPYAVIMMGAIAAGAAATLINAASTAQNAHTWKKEVNRRNRNS